MLRFRLHFLPDMPKLKLNFRKVVRQHMYGMVRSIMIFFRNLLGIPAVKEFWKSANNWQSYHHEFGVLLFGTQCTCAVCTQSVDCSVATSLSDWLQLLFCHVWTTATLFVYLFRRRHSILAESLACGSANCSQSQAQRPRVSSALCCSTDSVRVDMWRLVHQWSFLLFWLFLTIGTLLLFVGRGRRSRTQTLCI